MSGTEKCAICPREPSARSEYSTDVLFPGLLDGERVEVCRNCWRQAEKADAVEHPGEGPPVIRARAWLQYLRGLQHAAATRGKR